MGDSSAVHLPYLASEDGLPTLQAFHVEGAVGRGSASGYSALAPHGSEARPYPVDGIGVRREEGCTQMVDPLLHVRLH